MKRTYQIGRIGPLTLSAHRSVPGTLSAMWLVLALIGHYWLNLPPAAALSAALAATLGHGALVLAHQAGHAVAAHRTGYPMTGIRLWGPLSASLYPRHEPPLPVAVHVRRALGGPLASLLVSLALALVVWMWPGRGAVWAVWLFLLADNVLVFTLGALLPLPFTDGGTLLALRRRA